MALRQILEFPDPRLRTIAKPVAVVDESIRQLIDDMFETMYEANGIGLAASQIDVHVRVVVIEQQHSPSGPLPRAMPLRHCTVRTHWRCGLSWNWLLPVSLPRFACFCHAGRQKIWARAMPSR